MVAQLAQELRLLAVLSVMLTVPGWAILTIGHSWRRWQVLQRWIVAVGLSIAVYPVLFYGLRFALPWVRLGPYKIGAFLLVCGAAVVWRVRHRWRQQFAFDGLEWVALAVFGMTLFTRLWIVRDLPYPAWVDSLHHVLLTEATAVQGRLPLTMEPDFPIPLGRYHLGLYSLSATVRWIAQVPAHTALLWTAQALNGLCGLGVYLLLDRRVGRVGAIVGAATVGLLSHQPAFYVNWGRFTQIAAQSILLVALVVAWEALSSWTRELPQDKGWIAWSTLCAALLTGAVFLLHFRVAVFYVPLFAICAVWEVWQAHREGRSKWAVLGLAATVGLTLVIVAPALGPLLVGQVTASLNPPVGVAQGTAVSASIYYEFPPSVVSYLVGREWLLVIAGAALLVGLIKRDRLVIACLLWVVALWLLGHTYVLSVPWLNVTNLGAVLMMLYLPIGIIIGTVAHRLISLALLPRQEKLIRFVASVVLVGGFVFSHVRVQDIERNRFFVTPADVAAMEWIRSNTPQEALFAVNTEFWMPGAPHGTDAGYWIPYFTGRATTAGVMLINLAPHDYWGGVVKMSQAAERLETDSGALENLRALGVSYVYDGPGDDYYGSGVAVDHLSQLDGVTAVYQRDGVSILKIEA